VNPLLITLVVVLCTLLVLYALMRRSLRLKGEYEL
jgi:hypothetical protein